MTMNAMNLASTPEPIIARVMHSTNASRSIGALLMDAGRITPEAAERILKLKKTRTCALAKRPSNLGCSRKTTSSMRCLANLTTPT